MNLKQVMLLIHRARKLTNHREAVVIGSNSILGLEPHVQLPPGMVMSMDCDSYLRLDPGRTGDLAAELGEGSAFHMEHGFYLDPVNPKLPTLPEDWESRMIPVDDGDVRVWFLDPNDAAVSKYARGEERDQRWIRAGLESLILSVPRIRALFAKTLFLDAAEERAARGRLDADEAWLAERFGRPAPPAPKDEGPSLG